MLALYSFTTWAFFYILLTSTSGYSITASTALEAARNSVFPHVLVFARQNDDGLRKLKAHVLQHANPAFPRLYESEHLTTDQVNSMTYDAVHSAAVVETMARMGWKPVSPSNRDTIIFVHPMPLIHQRTVEGMQELWTNALGAARFDAFDHIVPVGRWRNLLPQHSYAGASRMRLHDKGTDFTTPYTLRRFHGFADDTSGSGVKIGPMEFQGYPAPPMVDYREYCSMTHTFCPTHIDVHGPYHPMPGAAESPLDLQTICGMLPNATCQYWTAEEWIVDGMFMLFNSTDRPDVVSISYGWCEQLQKQDIVPQAKSNADYIRRGNNEILKVTALGTSVVVADGDAGDPGRAYPSCGGVCAAWPAASPWVTAVGALRPVKYTTGADFPACEHNITCIHTVQEAQGVNFRTDGWTTGGGISCANEAFEFQHSYSAYYMASDNSLPGLNCTGRPFADVTSLGTNFLTVMSGQDDPVGGTSASAPAVAATLGAIISEMRRAGHRRYTVGYANLMLYSAALNAKGAFVKPEARSYLGCTESECCQHGFYSDNSSVWDPVYGFGAPQVRHIVNATMMMSCA